MKKNLIYFVLLFVGFACGNHKPDKQEREVEQSPSPKDTVFIINKVDSAVDFTLEYIAEPDGRIKLDCHDSIYKVPCTRAYVEVIQNEVPRYRYWLSKGEKYKLSIDENKKLIFHSLSGKDTPKELMFFRNQEDSIPASLKRWKILLIKYQLVIDKVNNKTFLPIAQKEYEDNLLFIQNNTHNTDLALKQMYQNMAIAEYLDLLSTTCVMHQNKKYLLPAYDTIQNNYKHMVNDSMLFSEEYREACRWINAILAKKQFDSFAYVDQYKSAQKNFSGETLKYLLFKIAKSSLYSKEPIDGLYATSNPDKIYWDAFLAEKETVNKQRLIEQQDKAAKEKIGAKELSLLASDQTIISMESLLKRHQGKIIYMDFWTSWCGPCRALMPLSHKMAEKYKNDVVFLYITLDNEASVGFNAAKEEKLAPERCFWSNPKGNIRAKYSIKYYPHYLIFNRKGELIDDNAFKPDDKDFDSKMQEFIQ